MNVARLNFSHGEHKWHKEAINNIREAAREEDAIVGILADLQGPRIRVDVPKEVSVKRGDEVIVSDKKYKKTITDFSSKVFYLDHAGVIDQLRKGHEILVEDGLIKVKVIEKKKNLVKTRVIDGGIIKNHKGVNIPGADLDIDVVTSKDKKDLEFVLAKDVDFVALSFVKNGKDVLGLRKRIEKILKRDNNLPHIVAKIERKEAIDNLDDILESTDVVMVARGDLGIEVDECKVAVLQKWITSKSLEKLKPVIVATQMLDSMIENPRPTRAEVSDVSNAVIDHTDAVMLSGESANGKHPVESVQMMNDIIQTTEKSPYDDVHRKLEFDISSDYALVVQETYELAKSFKADAILAVSLTGFTARLISHFRPEAKILVATNNKKTLQQISLLWGTEGYHFEKGKHLEKYLDDLTEKAIKEKKLKKGDKVVFLMGKLPTGQKMRLIGVKVV